MTVGNLTGQVHTWELFDKKRVFGEVTLPYRQAREYVMSVLYKGDTGKGQQREIVDGHLRKLRTAMESGSYTPTPAAANLARSHREALKIDGDNFSLDVSSDDPLLQTDAGHRFEALARIVKELEEKVSKSTGDEQEKQQRWLTQALTAPVTITVYFDGDAQRDFVNLQLGRPVDAAHMLSIKVQQRLTEPVFKLAFEVAKLLNKQEGSPFHHSIRFDSRGSVPLPISSLCAKGSSDCSTSLVGLAQVGLIGQPREAASLANCVIAAYRGLAKNASGLLEYGKVLTPLANSGKKGSSSMLVGLGIALSYRLHVFGRPLPTDDDIARLVQAAEKTLDKDVGGNLSGPAKRQLIGSFVQEFLADLPGDRHDDLPLGLVQTLSASAFGVTALPKAPKEKKKKGKRKAAPVVAVATPIVTGAEPAPAATLFEEDTETVFGEAEAEGFREPVLAGVGPVPWERSDDDIDG